MYGLRAVLAATSLMMILYYTSPGIAKTVSFNPQDERSVARFLRPVLTRQTVDPDRETRIIVRHLQNERVVIVYVAGGGWCGSGGCNLLILDKRGTAYRIMDWKTTVRLPIILTGESHSHMPDLAFYVEGGGNTVGKFALLRFNGKRYGSSSPLSANGLVKLKKSVEIIQAGEIGKPLY